MQLAYELKLKLAEARVHTLAEAGQPRIHLRLASSHSAAPLRSDIHQIPCTRLRCWDTVSAPRGCCFSRCCPGAAQI